jgi:hypothetical protein
VISSVKNRKIDSARLSALGTFYSRDRVMR